jgi:membrane-bound lytic murein transglycosylase D
MLETLYKRLGSWELALAGYNAGIGTVLNAQKKHPGADYWELCRLRAFKNETIHYVPKLVAAAWVLSNPRRFGIEPVWPEDPRWTRIPAGRSVDLGIVAEYAGLSGFDLQKANGELTYGITPPDPNYHIKAPAKYAPAIVSVLEDPGLTLIKYYFHTIQSGDTLSGIARRYGVTENQIRSNNPGLRDKYLKIGQRLIIPALKEINLAITTVKQETTVSHNGTHLVKRGETFWSIARAYNTSPEYLARINGMKLNDTLQIGSSLKTP